MQKLFKHTCPGFTYATITGAGLLTFQVPCGAPVPRSSGHVAATRCKSCNGKHQIYERMIDLYQKRNGKAPIQIDTLAYTPTRQM